MSPKTKSLIVFFAGSFVLLGGYQNCAKGNFQPGVMGSGVVHTNPIGYDSDVPECAPNGSCLASTKIEISGVKGIQFFASDMRSATAIDFSDGKVTSTSQGVLGCLATADLAQVTGLADSDVCVAADPYEGRTDIACSMEYRYGYAELLAVNETENQNLGGDYPTGCHREVDLCDSSKAALLKALVESYQQTLPSLTACN